MRYSWSTLCIYLINTQTQTELDEQLARRLMYEEQQRHDQSRRQNQYGQGPYQPRQGQGHDYQQAQGQWNENREGERDTMSEVQEQLTKFAESKYWCTYF